MFGSGARVSIDGFESLLALYRLSLKDSRQRVRRYWEALGSGELAEQEVEATVNDLRSQLHKLAGSAGSYGFDGLGDQARAMERFWMAWLAHSPNRRPGAAQAGRSLDGNYQRLLKMLDEAIAVASQASQAQE